MIRLANEVQTVLKSEMFIIVEVKKYTDLIVWQKAMTLVEEIYHLTESLPKEEQYGLCSQMRRAAVSIPSNIAEGQERSSTKEFVKFLSVARGSRAELETQLLLCTRLHYIEKAKADNTLQLCYEVGRMLNGLINRLTTSH